MKPTLTFREFGFLKFNLCNAWNSERENIMKVLTLDYVSNTRLVSIEKVLDKSLLLLLLVLKFDITYYCLCLKVSNISINTLNWFFSVSYFTYYYIQDTFIYEYKLFLVLYFFLCECIILLLICITTCFGCM